MKSGGQILRNAIVICETSKTSWQTGKHRMKDDLENHSKGPMIPFKATVEYHPTSPKDQARIHQFGQKVLPGMLPGYEVIAGRNWKGYILTADLEELEMMDASDIYTRRIKATEVLISQKDGEFVFPFADGTANLSGRDNEFRVPTQRRDQPVRRENLRGEIQDESEESQPAEPVDDAEARGDFWSIQGDFIYRHHTEPRVQLCVPKEESFPISLKYFDVTRSTHTDLDVTQEKKIDDHRNVDPRNPLSDSWRGFTKFILLKKSLQKDTCGLGRY